MTDHFNSILSVQFALNKTARGCMSC